jgi:hypothetical protein
MDKLVIPAGTIITCPKCTSEMAETLFDFFPGEKMSGAVKGLAWLPGVDSKPICPVCGTYFVVFDSDLQQHAIHTKGGWV